jgi:hypothetical protein
MAFTDEDRAVLVGTAVRVENMENWMNDLPCQQHPPECTQEDRLKSLETTRERAIKTTLAAMVGSVMAGLGYLFTKIGG